MTVVFEHIHQHISGAVQSDNFPVPFALSFLRFQQSFRKDFVSYNKKTTIDNFDFSSITRKEGAFNIIYYGIPGCGKSFIANQEALKLTNNENMICKTVDVFNPTI